MRTSTSRLAAGLAAAALALSGCTSDEPTPSSTSGSQDDSGDAAVTSDDGLTGEPGVNGWLCQYFSPSLVEKAAGGTAVTPRGHVVVDDPQTWECEVLTGGPGEQEPILRVGIYLGEEARDDRRAAAEAAEGMEPGPDYLGVSYVSPGLATALTMCTAPEATRRDDRIPYTLVAEALGQTTPEITQGLVSSLTTVAQNLDQGLGCSPKQAISEMGDDAAQTTAP